MELLIQTNASWLLGTFFLVSAEGEEDNQEDVEDVDDGEASVDEVSFFKFRQVIKTIN